MLNVPAHDEETSAQKTETGDATIEEPTELAPAYAPHQGLVEDIEPELFEDKIERAAELWTVRSQLARDAFFLILPQLVASSSVELESPPSAVTAVVS